MDRLTYIGHATTLLRLDGVSVLTDPMLRRWLGPLRRQGLDPEPDVAQNSDVVLISHLHWDHLDIPRCGGFRPARRWWCQGRRPLGRKGGAEDVREIGLGEAVSVAGVEVSGVPAVHDGYRGRHRGRPIELLGYLVSAGGRTVYFPGDTDLFPGMSGLGKVDVALLPVWGWGTSRRGGTSGSHARAARAVEMIRPRLVIPIHWGTLFPWIAETASTLLTEPPLEFARQVSRLAPDVEVRVLEPGSTTALRENEQRRLDRPGGLGRAPRHSALASDRLVLLGSRCRAARNRRAELRRSPDDHRPGRGAQRGVVAALDPAASPLTVLTFGLGSLVLNAAIISLSVKLVDGEAPDFLGAILVAFMLSVGLMLLARAQHRRRRETASSRSPTSAEGPRRRPHRRTRRDPVRDRRPRRSPSLRRAPAVGTSRRWPAGWSRARTESFPGNDLSSQTGASQAGLLLGSNDDMPAFRWYEKESGRTVVSNHGKDAVELERRHSDGGGLLAAVAPAAETCSRATRPTARRR